MLSPKEIYDIMRHKRADFLFRLKNEKKAKKEAALEKIYNHALDKFNVIVTNYTGKMDVHDCYVVVEYQQDVSIREVKEYMEKRGFICVDFDYNESQYLTHARIFLKATQY